MELLALGAVAYLVIKQGVDEGIDEAIDGEVDKAEEKFDSYRTHVEEMRAVGGWAPFHAANRGQTPWPVTMPPYYIAPDVHGVLDSPAERIRAALAIPGEHERSDVAEQALNGREHFARRGRAPIWTAFTREISVADVDGSRRSTDRLGFSWMPPDPTDSDWNEAGQIARALPGIDELMTPDATFLNVPGMNFRYGYGSTV